MTPASSGPILPEDVPDVKDTRGVGPHEVTWDHPNHGSLTTEPLCDVCNGKRYNRETLEVKYRGKSINDVLSMSIEEGVKFFEKIPKIHRKCVELFIL